MSYETANKQLFDVMYRQAFQPVLKTSEKDVPESKRDTLEHVSVNRDLKGLDMRPVFHRKNQVEVVVPRLGIG
ncbi:MAG: hypothetical protein M3Q42_12295 [Pseudomonadota bacterium]|nr:hypothetical protein [Pseudomonadota bacterium]